MGGYRNESPFSGILQLAFSRTAENESRFVKATWLSTFRMTPRSNHTATYVPAHVCGPPYDKGFLMVFGGNVHGQVSNTLDILDLATMEWQFDAPTCGHRPSPRNSHSATLVSTVMGYRVVVAGGGTGDGTNGGPPRGGADHNDVFLFDPINWSWEVEHGAHAQGRGHCAFRLMDSVLTVSGGRVPSSRSVALVCSREGFKAKDVNYCGRRHPDPVAFGGGCATTDGTLIMYGGWHPFYGTSGDFWVGHVSGCLTDTCAELCKHKCQTQCTDSPGKQLFHSCSGTFLRIFWKSIQHPLVWMFFIAAISNMFSSRGPPHRGS